MSRTTDLTIYDSLKREVESAGFHTSYMGFTDDNDHELDAVRFVCAGQRFTGGLTGNSFWIFVSSGKWFLGTWGGLVYRVPSNVRVADVCISWLRINPNRTVSDIDGGVREAYGLERIPNSEIADEMEI